MESFIKFWQFGAERWAFKGQKKIAICRFIANAKIFILQIYLIKTVPIESSCEVLRYGLTSPSGTKTR